MSDSVVTLADTRAKPIPDIVERCEWLLENAKSGNLRELMFISMMANSGGYENWASGTDDSCRQLGQIARLQHRINRSMDRQMNDGRGE